LYSFINLGAEWEWVIDPTPQPIYPPGKGTLCSLHRRLGGPQGRSGHARSFEMSRIKSPTPRRNNPEHLLPQYQDKYASNKIFRRSDFQCVIGDLPARLHRIFH
jgi:hypothetical protein